MICCNSHYEEVICLPHKRRSLVWTQAIFYLCSSDWLCTLTVSPVRDQWWPLWGNSSKAEGVPCRCYYAPLASKKNRATFCSCFASAFTYSFKCERRVPAKKDRLILPFLRHAQMQVLINSFRLLRLRCRNIRKPCELISYQGGVLFKIILR